MTPGLNEYISGVILFDETIRQRIGSKSIVETLAQLAIVPGIKVDKGTVALAGFPREKITEGLDGLRERLAEYYTLGARFTKWRAVIAIGKSIPTHTGIEENADTLARFAALSQEAGLVPIVEPEILMEGKHSLARCEEVTCKTLECVFGSLFEHQVALEHVLLKTGMILPGSACAEQADAAAVADATLRCLRRTVPAAVPGIVFLSGGQSDVLATERLNAICSVKDLPWTLSFSFGRALQDMALKTWRGCPANVTTAQATLHHRAKCNSLALQGTYSAASESEPSVNAQREAPPVFRKGEPTQQHQEGALRL
jgi:fructose-bisphosphate aldolase class I